MGSGTASGWYKTSRSGMLLLAGFLIGAILLPGAGQPQPAQADTERLVLAFYYAWYDKKTWNSDQVSDIPLSPYASSDREAMARHIKQARTAGIDAFVLNWWGMGNPTEKNLKALLDTAAQQGFRVAVDFDINSPFMDGVGSYAENLRHLHTSHALHPAYLRYQGRPVVFFYNVSRFPVSTWRSLRDQADPNRSAIWIAEGTDVSYLSVFDGHHLYSVTWPNRIPPAQTLPKWGDRVRKYNREQGTAKLWVATVMPGYDDRKVRPGSGFARSRDGGEYYRHCWQAAIASKPHWVIVNSFNEWPEGTYIEPSQAYGQLYLDLTREWAARFKGAGSAASAASPSPTPTAAFFPITPEPAPTLCPTVQVTDGAFLSTRDVVHQGYGHVLARAGAALFWAVYCPLGIEAGHPMIRAY
jgi:hypothetical protein